MNELYIKENTKDWKLLDSDNDIELWTYFDSVDWNVNHCIKVNGQVKVVIDDDTDIKPYNAFELAVKLLK